MNRAHWLVVLTVAFCPGAASAQPPPPGTLSAPIPPGTLDPRAPVKPLDEARRAIARERLAAPALERYAAGDYAGAARLGREILAEAPQAHELRLAVANSLAWTGRPHAAAAQYRALLGTPYDAQARVGMANVLRWRGRADLAEPLYLEALAREAASQEAAEGLALARRELRPSLTTRGSRTVDNDLRRDEISLTYRRWTDERRWRFEAGALLGRHEFQASAWTAHGMHAAAWAATLPLSPQLEAAWYDGGGRARIFATAQVEPVREQLKLRAGRVDWGRLAFSAGAAQEGLTARLLGATAEADFPAASVHARLDHYDISDGNRILDGEAYATPAWQPLPWRLAWFGGLAARDSRREDPRYWSPRPAYVLGFLGLRGSWSFERTELSASLRRGVGFSDTAGESWSAGLSARRWVARELALGLDAWTVDAPRPTSYRVHHVSVSVQWLL